MSARDDMPPDAHAMAACERVLAGFARADVFPDRVCNGSGLTRYIYLFGEGVYAYVCIESLDPEEDEVNASQAVAVCVRDRHLTGSLTFNHNDSDSIDRAIAWMLEGMS